MTAPAPSQECLLNQLLKHAGHAALRAALELGVFEAVQDLNQSTSDIIADVTGIDVQLISMQSPMTSPATRSPPMIDVCLCL